MTTGHDPGDEDRSVAPSPHPGDMVLWRPTRDSPYGSLLIMGEVVAAHAGRVTSLRVSEVAGHTRMCARPRAGHLVDPTMAPGSMTVLAAPTSAGDR